MLIYKYVSDITCKLLWLVIIDGYGLWFLKKKNEGQAWKNIHSNSIIRM